MQLFSHLTGQRVNGTPPDPAAMHAEHQQLATATAREIEVEGRPKMLPIASPPGDDPYANP